MCGISGVLSFTGEPPSPAVLEKMAAAVAHRGPDGEGFYRSGPIGLVHRRLAVIDLTPAAQQPMVTEDGRYALTYNGELYNFRELRSELEQCGYSFHSRTDSEVVLKAFAAWGPKVFSRFNGMFALALWDAREQQLLLARDRYGIKPLYYWLKPSLFLFGSEVKAILAHPDTGVTLDQDALVEYFTFQNFFTDRTLFEGVRMLGQGTYMVIPAATGGRPSVTRYWDFTFAEPEHRKSEADYIEQLDGLFQQAVTRQLVSDVDVGAYLSGGMDSGSITAVAARQLPYIKTFTAGFDLHSVSGIELTYDEREQAEHLSYLLKTEHYEMVLKSGDMERVMPRLTHHLEEPRVGQSYPNFYVAQLAAKFVKVVLSGTGGDEMFGGYPWRYYRAVVNDDFDHYAEKYYAFWQRLVPDESASQVFAPIWPAVKQVSTRQIFREVFSKHADSLTRPEDYINHSLYFEAKTFLHGLLVLEDKLSMAHGIETRVPFLDNDLVDFAMTIPANLKLGSLTEVVQLNENEPGPKTARYFSRTRDGKLILRKAMSRYLPDEIVGGEKKGFSAPDASWFKGDSIEYVKRVLLDRNARIYQFLSYQHVAALIEDHFAGRVNRRLLIWSLLSFQWWCTTFLP